MARDSAGGAAATRRRSAICWRPRFPGFGEATLVDRLRRDGDIVLSLVAEDEGVVIGYIAFSRLMVEGGDATFRAVALAPLAVYPEYQQQGIATRLVREGHACLAAIGETLSVVVGEPHYYGRFGYSQPARGALRKRIPIALPDGALLRRGAVRRGGSSIRRPSPRSATMPRYKLTIEYDGGPFVGWQRQANGRSVQQAIEEALVRLTGESADHPRRGAHRRRRARARPGGAFRPRARLDRRQAARRAECASAAGAGRHSSGRAGRRRFRCALLGDPPALLLSHPHPPRAAGRSTAAASGMSARPLDAVAMHRAAQALCSARTTSRRSAPPSARRRARSGRSTGSTS